MPSAHPCRQQHQDKKRASCIFARTGFSYRLPLSLSHCTAGAGPHRAPPAGVTAGSHGTEVPPGAGSTGQGRRGHRDGCSGPQREAPSLGKPSPGGGGCCPRRGSGASAARCSQGAHSAPDAFSNLARLARLRQRGRGASALTLTRPRGRPRCEGVPSGQAPGPGQRSRGPAGHGTRGAAPCPGHSWQHPAGRERPGCPSPHPKPRHHTHPAEVHVSPRLTES